MFFSKGRDNNQDHRQTEVSEITYYCLSIRSNVVSIQTHLLHCACNLIGNFQTVHYVKNAVDQF